MADPTPSRRRHKTPPPPLSLREIRFCQNWVEHRNGTRAYREAGYTAASDSAAWVGAFRVLRKPKIRDYIRELQSEAADVARITVNRIARSLDWVAHADRTAIFDDAGQLLPVGQWPQEVRAIVTGFEVQEGKEDRIDPETGEKKPFVVRTVKVKFERSTEAKKILAQWKRMIGQGKEGEGAGLHRPLVIGGEADPESL